MESTLDPIAAGKSDQIWGTTFSRRIEFHLARKPFTGFGNGSGGFHLETLNPSSNSALATGMTPAPGNPQLKKIGGDFDQELSLDMTFRKIMRIGAGLQNLGNTCYLNAVLQCLTYTEPLAAYLESGKHQNSCRKAGFCALCAIQKHVTHALQATGRILAPKDLVSNLRCISRNFRNSRQEDAHEYMVNLLESMHKCCLPSGIPSESPSAYEKSLVHRIFGGRLRSRVKCMQCSYCSDKLDPFLDISLEIIKADSLYKALERFTAQELLDGGEKQYSCQQCKQKVRACKQLTIDNAPNVLTIHLKRFGSHLTGQKILKKIHYGPVLDLNRFMSNPHTGDLKYTLYGVLVHAGWSTHSGHYYCFVRTSSGMWYSLDDNQVFQVSEKMVLDQKAYMLFYVRDRKSNLPKKPHVDVVHNKDTSSINGIRNKERECDPTNGASSIQRDTLNITTSPKEASSQAVVSLEANSLLQKVIVSESSSLVVPTRDMNKDDSSGDTCTNKPVARKSIPLNEGNGKATLKVRKKPFKPHIMFVRLSSIIFGTALRKRKHKLRKHMISHKNLSLEYTNKQHFLPALGQPDTSKERTGHTDKQQLAKVSSSTSLGNKSDGVESNGLTDQKQSGLINMLTRGLEETRVACWDGIQRSSAVGGARNEYANIGYIGDEWDEQYDQGKRKKVRSSKLDFGGPNPFQEIASTKANLKKKAKLGHYRSANQPFRI